MVIEPVKTLPVTNYFLAIEVVQTLAVRYSWEFGTDFTFSLPVLICVTDNTLQWGLPVI